MLTRLLNCFRGYVLLFRHRCSHQCKRIKLCGKRRVMGYVRVRSGYFIDAWEGCPLLYMYRDSGMPFEKFMLLTKRETCCGGYAMFVF